MKEEERQPSFLCKPVCLAEIRRKREAMLDVYTGVLMCIYQKSKREREKAQSRSEYYKGE